MKLSELIIAADLTPHSRAALMWAEDFSKVWPDPLRLHLIHVSKPDGRSTVEQFTEVHARMDEWCQVPHAFEPDEMTLLGGDAADEILAFAADRPDAWLALSRASHVGLLRLALGSVANAIATRPTVPTVFVHPERAALTPGAPIVVGTDFSLQSIRATHLACALAARLNSPLHVIHANPNPAVSVFEGTNVDVASLKAEAFAQARKRLEELADELRSLWSNVNAEVTAEFPAEALLARAEQLQADHLVVGFSGESPLMQHVLGSTALKCLNKAPCNLVLVPTQ